MDVYVRGNHNARQVFMLWKNDGSYMPIEPLVISPSVWRYTKHMAGMINLNNDPNNEISAASSLYRSPLLALAPGGRPLSPRASIINSVPGGGYAPFVPPFPVPEPFASMPSRFVSNNFHDRYLNTGQWC
ncbi:hypothetical protein BDZ45DRAFT_427142 [Acephala macrosclerotiorum]|nr:hypothetical protein BDZ45DRAFT_427142 [Acephala macrosclerotiorum]